MWCAYRPVEGEELLTSALLELVDGCMGGRCASRVEGETS